MSFVLLSLEPLDDAGEMEHVTTGCRGKVIPRREQLQTCGALDSHSPDSQVRKLFLENKKHSNLHNVTND